MTLNLTFDQPPAARTTNWKVIGFAAAAFAGGAAFIDQSGKFGTFWNWLNPVVWVDAVQNDPQQANVDAGDTRPLPRVVATVPGGLIQNPTVERDVHGVKQVLDGSVQITGDQVIADGYRIVGRDKSLLDNPGGGNGHIILHYQVGHRLPLFKALGARFHDAMAFVGLA